MLKACHRQPWLALDSRSNLARDQSTIKSGTPDGIISTFAKSGNRGEDRDKAWFANKVFVEISNVHHSLPDEVTSESFAKFESLFLAIVRCMKMANEHTSLLQLQSQTLHTKSTVSIGRFDWNNAKSPSCNDKEIVVRFIYGEVS